MKKLFLIIFGSILGSTIIGLNAAEASSPEAWEKHYNQVISSCTKASNLLNAQAVGKVMLIDDYSALLVSGKYSQAHMKNKTGYMLCLYNRGTNKVSVGEANEMVSPILQQSNSRAVNSTSKSSEVIP